MIWKSPDELYEPQLVRELHTEFERRIVNVLCVDLLPIPDMETASSLVVFCQRELNHGYQLFFN